MPGQMTRMAGDRLIGIAPTNHDDLERFARTDVDRNHHMESESERNGADVPPGPIPVVIVDTTELHNIPLLDAGGWRELLTRCRKEQVRVIVPEVVLREATRHFRKSVSDLNRAHRILKGLGGIGLNPPDLSALVIEIGDGTEFYSQRIRSRLTANEAEVAPLPSVSHEQMLERDLATKRPFNDSGKGYRDALIWETVLEIADRQIDASSHMYFVTNNKSDFCGADGEMAQELLDEVQRVRGSQNITRVKTVAEVIKKLRHHFERWDAYQAQLDEEALDLATTDIAAIVAEAVVNAAEGLVGEAAAEPVSTKGTHIGNPPIDIRIPRFVEEPTIEQIEIQSGSVDFSVYERYVGPTLAMRASIDAELTLHGYIDKEDYLLADDDAFEVLDEDWDDDLMRVEFDRTVRCWFELLVIGDSIDSIEFDGAEELSEQ